MVPILIATVVFGCLSCEKNLVASSSDFMGVSFSARCILHSLDLYRFAEEEVRTLIQCVPGALTFKDFGDSLPIHSAALHDKSVLFVPVLAEEGLKLNIGDGTRGGLLIENEEGDNVLESVVSFYHGPNSPRVDVLKRLREMGLFEEKDVVKFDLLPRTCSQSMNERFEYLITLYPEALCHHPEIPTATFLHFSIEDAIPNEFALAFDVGLRFYPDELGLLLRQDENGITFYEAACQEFGTAETWEIIENCFEAAGCKDIFLNLDKVKNVYPFMIAAEHVAALDLVYYFLRKSPSVFEYTQN